MDTTVHNPDQYMLDFRQIITNGRKKIGLLIGDSDNYKPLIPNIEGLTNQVRENLKGIEKDAYISLEQQVSSSNIELVLSRVRGLSEVIGATEVCV